MAKDRPCLKAELFDAAADLDGEEVLIPGTQKSSGLVLVSLRKYQRLVQAVSALIEAAEPKEQ